MTWFPPQRYGMLPTGVHHRNLSRGALATYGLITTYANRHGYCTVGDSTFAQALGVSRRTAQRYLHELVEAGLLDRKQRQHQVPVTKLVPVEAPATTQMSHLDRSSHDTDGAPGSLRCDRSGAQNSQEPNQQTRTKEQPVPPPPAAAGREEHMPDPRLTGEAVDYDDGPPLRGKAKRSTDLVKLGTNAWVEERFKATVLNLGASHFNIGHFRSITKTLRDQEDLSNEEIVQIIEIWEAQDPGLRQKLVTSGANASQLFHQDVLNNGGLLRYRANQSIGAPAPGEVPWAVTAAEQQYLDYEAFYTQKETQE